MDAFEVVDWSLVLTAGVAFFVGSRSTRKIDKADATLDKIQDEEPGKLYNKEEARSLTQRLVGQKVVSAQMVTNGLLAAILAVLIRATVKCGVQAFFMRRPDPGLMA